ncbi:MAG: hypothetical protein ABH800_01845 [Candidatus Nealsonbacteria bacterium]
MKKQTLSIVLITGILLAGFPFSSFAETSKLPQIPENFEEAKSFVFDILKAIPEAAKDVWHNEAWPFFLNVWDNSKSFWEKNMEPKVKIWWQKLSNLFNKEVEERKPGLKEEFQKEKEEMKADLPKIKEAFWSLWQKIKDF